MENWRTIFPPKPSFEEKDVPELSGKVYLVTGGASGVGFELCKMLYGKNGTVYIAGRSQANADAAINEIKEAHPNSDGALHFLHLDLSDLPTIRASAEAFKQKERRLDVVVHNAGVMIPPPGSKTKQGWDLQFGTNVLGHFVFQKHLQDIMFETAKIAPKDSVRVCWASSSAQRMAPQGGVVYEDLENMGLNQLSSSSTSNNWLKYAQSKAGNNLLAAGYADKFKDSGVLSVSFNPGNLKSNLQRHTPWYFFIVNLFLYHARYGGITELFCALSPQIDSTRNGVFVQPWGRVQPLRKDIQDSIKEGGGEKLWDWCDEKMKAF